MRHTSVAGELSGSKVHSLKTSVRLPVISLSRQVPQLQGGKGGTPRAGGSPSHFPPVARGSDSQAAAAPTLPLSTCPSTLDLPNCHCPCCSSFH